MPSFDHEEGLAVLDRLAVGDDEARRIFEERTDVLSGDLSALSEIREPFDVVIHSASTTHSQLTDAQKIAAGAGPDVVRLSIGIENAEDLIADLDQALAAATA